MNKSDICAAFCGELEVRTVPAGLAVKTPFIDRDGDYIGFYVVNDSSGEAFRLEDSGLVVPKLEAAGVSLSSGPRADILRSLLNEYEAEVDEESSELRSSFMGAELLPAASLRFAALLLRIQDLEFLRPESVESAFADDVRKAISDRFSGVADVSFPTLDPASEDEEYRADIVVQSDGQIAAVFLGTRDARVDEAVMGWMDGQLRRESNIKYAVLYEQDKHIGVSMRSFRRAQNRLDASLIYRHDEAAAIDRIGRMIGVSPAVTSQSIH